MKLRELLAEKMIERVHNIALNPTRAELARIMSTVRHRDEEPIRALLDRDTGDLYLWNAYNASHGGIKDRYGIEHGIHLMITPPSEVRVLTLWRYERWGEDEESIHTIVSQNRYLTHLLPDLTITIQP